MKTFNSLPLFYQYKLARMLPKCDQIETAEGFIKPGPNALRNEFFNRASRAWEDRLKEGKLTPEFLLKWKNDLQREKAKLDPWKLKNFEPVWGQPVESQKHREPRVEHLSISKNHRIRPEKCPLKKDSLSIVRENCPSQQLPRTEPITISGRITRAKALYHKIQLASSATSESIEDKPSSVDPIGRTLKQINKSLTIEPVNYDPERSKTLFDSIRVKSFANLKPNSSKRVINSSSNSSIFSTLPPSSTPSPLSTASSSDLQEAILSSLPYKLPSGTSIIPFVSQTPPQSSAVEVPVVKSSSKITTRQSSSRSLAPSSSSSSTLLPSRSSPRLIPKSMRNSTLRMANKRKNDVTGGEGLHLPSQITVIPIGQTSVDSTPESLDIENTSSSSSRCPSSKVARILPKPMDESFSLPKQQQQLQVATSQWTKEGTIDSYNQHIDPSRIAMKDDHFLILPPQITVIPLGQPQIAQPPVNNTYYISTNSNMITDPYPFPPMPIASMPSTSSAMIPYMHPVSSAPQSIVSDCPCNLKTLVVKCCSYCHHDYVGPLHICYTCLVR